MEIVQYLAKYENDVKMLFRELQEYIVNLDPYHFNLVSSGYEDMVFSLDMKKIHDNNGKIFLALDNDIIVGFIMGIIHEPVVEFDFVRPGKMGEVIELVVTKKIRHCNVGNKLLEKMEGYFRENNCQTINIDVFGYNDIARNFYFKNGYHERMVTVSKKFD